LRFSLSVSLCAPSTHHIGVNADIQLRSIPKAGAWRPLLRTTAFGRAALSCNRYG